MIERPLRTLLWVHRLAGGATRTTGVGRYTVETVRALTAAGEPVSVTVGSCREASRPDWLPEAVDVRRMSWPRPLVHASWLVTPWPKIESTGADPDLVHVLYPSFPVRCRAPLVYTVHDVLPVTNPEWYRPLERAGFHRSLADARRRAAVTVTDSAHVARLLVDELGFDPARVCTIHPGVSGRFSDALPDEVVTAVLRRLRIRQPYVVHVGMLAARKDVPLLVEALAQRPELGAVSLVLAGPDRGEGREIADLAERRGIRSRVRMLGVVEEADLPALVQGAEALVHPARDEGFGFTPLEAMAAGTVAIVSDGGSLPEIVGEAALIAPREPEAWAAAMERVTTDTDLAGRLRSMGRRRAAEYSWDDYARALRTAYRMATETR